MSEKLFESLFSSTKLPPDIERYIPMELKPSLLAAVQTNNLLSVLHETIAAQIKATNRQSVIFSRLTWAAVFLGFVQAAGTVVQVWLAVRG